MEDISSNAPTLLAQLERKKRIARTIAPTDNERVKERLRELEQPITLFGEGPQERRDRLREFIVSQQEEAEAAAAAAGHGADGDGDVVMGGAVPFSSVQQTAGGDEGEQEVQEEFWTAGTPALLATRQAIARSSLRLARQRIKKQRELIEVDLKTHIAHRNRIKEHLKAIVLYGTQSSDRPVSCTRFSPSGNLLASTDWGGTLRLLSLPNLEDVRKVKAHSTKIGGLAWHPHATSAAHNHSPAAVNIATAGFDSSVNLWSLPEEATPDSATQSAWTPLATLNGHAAECTRVAFHPQHTHLLASTSKDTTFRFWDLNVVAAQASSGFQLDADDSCILLQEGHSREVNAIAFAPDGALVTTGGADCMGRIWDLRTGRTAMILEGHLKPIQATSWAPDGHRCATGSLDGTVRIWDVRMVRERDRVLANSGGVTDVRWYDGEAVRSSNGDTHIEMNGDAPHPALPASGTFILAAGMDKCVRIVSADDWSPAGTLSGHAGHVLSTDFSHDTKWLVSGGYDRTIKLWGSDDGAALQV